MRAGQLDRRVVVQRKVSSVSESGSPIETWSAIGPVRWARRLPAAADERFTADTLAAREQVNFDLRWSLDLADLQPLDRIIEPAGAASADPIPTRSIYDILGVNEIGRREGLHVLTMRRADVVP